MRPADKFREMDPPLECRAFEKAIRKMGYTAYEAKVIVSSGLRSLIESRHEQALNGARDKRSRS